MFSSFLLFGKIGWLYRSSYEKEGSSTLAESCATFSNPISRVYGSSLTRDGEQKDTNSPNSMRSGLMQ